MIAALGIIGVEAYPVLINAIGHPDSTLPTIRAFNHEIVAIKRPTGYQYVDPTSSLSRFETLPFTDAGKFALLVRADGTTEEVTTPPDPTDSNRPENRMTGELAEDGTFTGRVVVRGSGLAELGMRALMQNRLDSTQRAALLRRFASSIFPDAQGDSLVLFDGKDFRAPPMYSFVLRNGHATQPSGDVDILKWSGPGAGFTRIADEIEARGPRHQSIDASRVLLPVTFVQETRITLPAGWHARLPENVSATSVFGHFEGSYRQDGRDLIITHRSTGVRGIYPKDRVGELIAWLRECGKDRESFIMLEHHR